MSDIDVVQPFQLDIPNLRGRLVRLGPVLDSIVSRHNYPAPVAQLLAETLTLAILLAGMLKYDGIFTLQAKGDGAVGTLVADVNAKGAVRAYAQYDEEQLAQLPKTCSARELLGDGHMAFTVDQGLSVERYQGMVELEGQSLSDFAQAYFRQSEQIDTAFSIAASHSPVIGWRAGGLMLQRLPEEISSVGLDVEDGWRRVMMLMATLQRPELTDPKLAPNDLLFRLFHEEEVRVYPPTELLDQCRCSRERVAVALKTIPQAELAEMTTNGPAEVRCEFCSRFYHFTAAEVAALHDGGGAGTVH